MLGNGWGQNRALRSRLFWLFGLILGLGLSLATPSALGQISNPLGGSTNSAPPPAVERIGLLEATSVGLDGEDLFTIASPAVYNRSEPAGAIPVEVRARQIETNLNQVVTQALEPNMTDSEEISAPSLNLDVVIQQINGQPVLFATGASLIEPRVLLTVTDTDAQYNGLTQMALAERWQDRLGRALNQAIEGRQPEARQRQARRVLLILLGTVLLTLALAGIWKVLGWRKHNLEQRQTQGRELESSGNENDNPQQQFNQFLRYQISVEQRLQIVAFLRWLMFWGVAFVWTTGIALALYTFPQTRRYASGLFSTPVLLLLAWFLTGLLNRLANLGIDRIAQAWSKNELGSLDNIQRKSMRISTIIGATKGLKTTVIYALATLLVLQILKIAPVSLLAFGAVAALALSFAAQNLVKDLVNGFLILLEDQYAIGDLITAGTTTGIVENLNLRITQIRGEDGRLVTLPNSLIAQVDNLSRVWSRANLTINVSYHTDVDHALGVVQEVARTMAADPAWRHAILDPTEMLGVEAMTHAGMTILIWIRTRPLKQFLVAREFRRRLRVALEQEGIAIGIPQQELTGLGEISLGKKLGSRGRRRLFL
ncbi:MAG: mechanosensitive ion channel family protein [Leptolyngbyaceae cyanobacterium SM2_3_12]|nr:mechanosensitive ion channel family protein [Leptolyngbyaceae cyanobacterium SM2_3_12]